VAFGESTGEVQPTSLAAAWGVQARPQPGPKPGVSGLATGTTPC
jgi:hypothetical protein